MKAAVLDQPTPRVAAAVDAARVREIVLLRIASAVRGLTKADAAADLAPLIAHRLSPAQWRSLLDTQIEGLAAVGLIVVAGPRVSATEAGVTRVAAFIGLKGSLPRLWAELRDTRLVARTLRLERESAKRLKALNTPEGLRVAILQRAYHLKLKGVATPSRLRVALAAVALDRAFGNRSKDSLSGKLGLSAKASRLLAAQLSRRPRDYGTDARLVAALAAEQVGAVQADLAALQLALLRRFVEGEAPAPAAPAPNARPAVPTVRPRLVDTQPPVPASAAQRPDLAGFAREARALAAMDGQGWTGNRKTYISHLWRRIRDERAGWGLSEIEFKCMLAEAHRAGHVALAGADLKDARTIKDVQDSAVVYKNTVFHFIRVDG
jgi:hypothetical protein